ncbi:MAG TPA: carboxypeptidase regulatory-like domain-containing protein, partial [Blastococcus sp.]|nr:carboxypeptidase regulatory-like domain-containing protein [Blastococcus sp.]
MVRLLLVLAFALGLAAFSPGVAQAEATGEVLTGTVQTSRSGPIEDVQIEVTTPDGEEIESVETDAEGRWSVELPGPGEYVVTLDEGDLPDTVELSNTNTRTVTVDEGRRQAVIIGL